MDVRRANLQTSTLNPSYIFLVCEVDCGGCELCGSLITAVHRNKNLNAKNKYPMIQRAYLPNTDGLTGLHVYTHSLVKLTEHTRDQVEFSTNISKNHGSTTHDSSEINS